MMRLGKFITLVLLILFVAKAFAGSVLPVFDSIHQELVLDDLQENEETDDTQELKFLDFFYQDSQLISPSGHVLIPTSKKAINFFNSSLNIGYLDPAFRPPCN